MKDWKGNQVKVGDTVVVVTVKDMFEGSTMHLFICGEDGIPIDLVPPMKVEKRYLWEIDHRYLITEYGNTITSSNIESYSEVPINYADSMFICVQPHQIVCIEGVSDNKDEYYTEQFKV